jgi:hypothetical protein
VKQDAPGSNSGTSWENAFTDLQTAIDASKEGDQLWIAGGVYYTSDVSDRNATFRIKSGQKWYGGFQGNEENEKQRRISRFPSILSGNIGNKNTSSDNAYTVITAEDTDTTTLINGIDIVEGYANGASGGSKLSPKNTGAGLYIDIKSIPYGGVKLEQVDFIGNYSSGSGGAMVIKGNQQSKSIIHIDICFFYGNKSGTEANLIYAKNLLEGHLHKILDTQIRSGDITSSTSEIIIEADGSIQDILFKSNISGNILGNGKNSFLEVRNYTDQLNLTLIDNQLYSSHLERGYNIINYNGNINFIYNENDILDLETEITSAASIISFENPGQGIIHADFYENDFIRNHVSALIDVSEVSNISFNSNLFTRNKLIGSAILMNKDGLNLPHINISNEVFTYNEGALLVINNKSSASGNWSLSNSTFYDNYPEQNNAHYIDSDVPALIYFFGKIEDRLSIKNSIFHNASVSGNPVFFTRGATIDLSFNSLPLQDCGLVVSREGNGHVHCAENLYGLDPVFLSKDGKDVTLASCSPCIDAGDNAAGNGSNLLDYRGANNRILGGTIDMGAVEHTFISEEEKNICVEIGQKVNIPDYGESPYTYRWENNHGLSGTALDNLDDGLYKVTVTDRIGCPLFLEVNVYTPGNFNLINYDINRGISFCQGQVADIKVSDRYEVIWPDGSTGSTFAINESGSYKLMVNNGCISEEYIVEAFALNAKTEQRATVLCENDTLFLKQKPITSPGIYLDTLYYRLGCDSLIIEYSVSLGERKKVEIIGDQTICPGEETWIEINNGQSYLWSNGSQKSREWLDAGIHQVAVIDSNGCQHNLEIDIESYKSYNWIEEELLNKSPGQPIILTLNPDFQAEILEVKPSESVSIEGPDEVVINPGVSTPYQIVVGYGDGCIGIDSFYINVPFNSSELIQLSNIISVNEDGENEGMKIYADPNIQLKTLKVFDRWGMNVYNRTYDYNQAVYDGWDGRINNQVSASGVYVWLIEFSYNGQQYRLTGDVSIIR